MRLIRQKKNLLLAFIWCIPFALVLGFYFSKSIDLYRFFKSDVPHYSLSLFENNPRYGYKLISRSSGLYYQARDRVIPVYTNLLGHRITANIFYDTLSPFSRIKLVFAGDSYTFGEGCVADSTFVFNADRDISSIENLGTGGYGYVQMIESLKEFLPDHTNTNQIVFQISPWLGERCCRKYLDAGIIKVPVPYLYFADTDLDLHSPIYSSSLFAPTINSQLMSFRNSPASYTDFLSYLRHVAIPLYVNEGCHELSALVSSYPPPISQKEQAEIWALNELYKLRLKYKVDVYLLVIGYGAKEDPQYQNKYQSLIENYSFRLINADSVLWNAPGINGDLSRYENTFMHWNSEHTLVIDRHPNTKSHSLISKAINEMINK